MDEAQWEDFYLFEYPRIVRGLAFVAGDVDAARDAIDEACARAVERLERGRTIDALGAWIRVVALNVARGRLRRRSVERRARSRLLSAAERASTDLSALAGERIDVHRALAGLSRRHREVIVLHYFFDQDVESIAADLAIPPGTVKAALHRGRAALAQLLAEPPTVPAKEAT